MRKIIDVILEKVKPMSWIMIITRFKIFSIKAKVVLVSFLDRYLV